MALLEITNRRRTGGAFTFGIFGLLLLLRDALLPVVTLRFNINFQTKQPLAGSEKNIAGREKWLLTHHCVLGNLRTPED
jgi:hypothetical protein